MILIIARQLPMEINGDINNQDIAVFGPESIEDERPISFRTVSIHFKNYHLYLNPSFNHLDVNGIVMPDSSVASNDLKKGHRVHIFISKKDPSFTKTSLLQDFVLNAFNITGHPVIIHVMKEYMILNGEPFDELYDAVASSVCVAKEINQIQNAGEPKAKISPFKFVRERPGTITIFKVDDFVRQNPNIPDKCLDMSMELTSCHTAVIEFDEYHHIGYSFGKRIIRTRKGGMLNDGM